MSISAPPAGGLAAGHQYLVGGRAGTQVDSGIITGESVDVSAFLGSTVTVEFEWIVLESFVGPAGAFLDDVRLEGTAPAPATALLILAGVGMLLGWRRRG